MQTIQHVLTGSQFKAEELLEICQLADNLRKGDNFGLLEKTLQNQPVILIFEEPSTRTKLSFEIAVMKLGGHPIVLDQPNSKLSLAKEETIEDTLKTSTGLGCKIIIIRHKNAGLPMALAQFSDQHQLGLHIINAGDGNNEHPTQALLDLYTVWREKKEELKKGKLIVSYVGDLADSRVVHSGIQTFGIFGTEFVFICPPELRLAAEWLKKLPESTQWLFTSDILEFAGDIDVWNFTRLQKERKSKDVDTAELEKQYYQDSSLTKEVREKAKPNALFLHSRPRGKEIPPEADEDPRQRYIINYNFPDPEQNQETNGLYLRIALLYLMQTPLEI